MKIENRTLSNLRRPILRKSTGQVGEISAIPNTLKFDSSSFDIMYQGRAEEKIDGAHG